MRFRLPQLSGDPAGDQLGARRIAVQADRAHGELDSPAVHGDDRSVDGDQHSLICCLVFRPQGAALVAGNERSVWQVAAVREAFGDRSEPRRCRRGEQLRAWRPEHRRHSGGRARRRADPIRAGPIGGSPVVEGAVRLHVGHARLFGLRAALQDRDLLGRLQLDHGGCDAERPPAEPLAIAVADVRPDRHPVRPRDPAQPAHGLLVAGVKAAGDVRARDHSQQRFVTGHPLADVGVQIHHPLGHLAILATSGVRHGYECATGP